MPTHRPPRRVLIVDDDPDWRDFLRTCLEDLGYESAEASNGEDALRMLEREEFAVLLLDVSMPGLTGPEVLERLPSPGPRVVLLTSAPADELGDALSRTPSYYLPKDASAEALSLVLDSLHI